MKNGNRFIDLSGKKFARLLAVERDTSRRRVCWKCKCDCGAIVSVDAAKLKSGHTRSCGCFRVECRRSIKKHGEAAGGKFTPEYSIYRSMLQRCNNETSKYFHYYGGRGIKVCKRWLKFENFLKDMGRRPSARHSIERMNNDDGYRPGNCVWATKKEQCNNRRSCVVVHFRGKRMNLTQWAAEIGIAMRTIWNRIFRLGWPVEKSLTTPVKNHGKNIKIQPSLG